MSAPASSLPTAPSAPVVSVPMSCPLIPAGSSMVLTCAFMRVFSLVNNSSAASHLRRCRVVPFESPPILIQSQHPADKSPDKEQAEGLLLRLGQPNNHPDAALARIVIGELFQNLSQFRRGSTFAASGFDCPIDETAHKEPGEFFQFLSHDHHLRADGGRERIPICEPFHALFELRITIHLTSSPFGFTDN